MIKQVIKGVILGAAGVMPGALGTVLAVVLGVYERAVALLAHPLTLGKKHWRWWAPLLAGVAGGWLSLVWLVAHLWSSDDSQVFLLFGVLGLIVGLLPSLIKRANRQGVKVRHELWAAVVALGYLGLASYWQLSFLSPVVDLQVWGSVASGVLLGIGSLVPGFSMSLVLMSLGLFAPLLQALTNWSPLLIIVAGSYVLTLGLCSRFMHWCLRRWYTTTYYFFIGMTAGCLLHIWPPLPSGGDAVLALGILAIMTSGSYFITKLGKS